MPRIRVVNSQRGHDVRSHTRTASQQRETCSLLISDKGIISHEPLLSKVYCGSIELWHLLCRSVCASYWPKVITLIVLIILFGFNGLHTRALYFMSTWYNLTIGLSRSYGSTTTKSIQNLRSRCVCLKMQVTLTAVNISRNNGVENNSAKYLSGGSWAIGS